MLPALHPPVGSLNPQLAALEAYIPTAGTFLGFLAFGKKKAASQALATFGLQRSGANRIRKENKPKGCKRRNAMGNNRDAAPVPKTKKWRSLQAALRRCGCQYGSRLRVRRRRIPAGGHTRFQFAGRFIQLLGNFAQKCCATPFRFRRHFLLDVPAQARQFFIDAFPKFFKFIHGVFAGPGRAISVL